MWPTSIVLRTRSAAPQEGQGSPVGHLAQVVPGRDGDVALDVDAPQVEVVGVGAGRHVAAAPERQVREHGKLAHADGAEAAGRGAERAAHLVGRGRPELPGAGRVGELLLVQRVVAAQQQRASALRRARRRAS